jgi:hypothetical protein
MCWRRISGVRIGVIRRGHRVGVEFANGDGLGEIEVDGRNAWVVDGTTGRLRIGIGSD